MAQAVVAGHICVDVMPSLSSAPSLRPGVLVEVGALRMAPGGCVAGTGTALHELGVATRLVADVGDDALGGVLVAALRDMGLDAAGIVTRPGASTSYSIVVEPPGTDRTFWHHVGANATFDGADVTLDGVDLLHLGYPTLLPRLWHREGEPWEQLLRRAAAHEVATSVDFATLDPGSDAANQDWGALLRRVLPLTDVITPSTDDVAGLLGLPCPSTPAECIDLASHLIGLGAGVVLLTHGAEGLVAASSTSARLGSGSPLLRGRAASSCDRAFWVPSAEVTVRTTTGAGDAATAGFLAALLEGRSLLECGIAAATTAGARVAGVPLAAAGQLALKGSPSEEASRLPGPGPSHGPAPVVTRVSSN